MCSTFNLTETEVSDLADYMGHSESVHKRTYRQPIILREIMNKTKLLETVQGGGVGDGDGGSSKITTPTTSLY